MYSLFAEALLTSLNLWFILVGPRRLNHRILIYKNVIGPRWLKKNSEAAQKTRKLILDGYNNVLLQKTQNMLIKFVKKLIAHQIM
jgi:hypothetical protein